MIKGMAFVLLTLALWAGPALAQDLNYSLNSNQTQAVLNGGVSYDLLRYPTNVSFDYPEGYLSFNIPLDLTTNKYDLGAKLDSSNKKFTPLIGARQRLNYSFRINVPMLRGVLSYSQTENVNFDFGMNLGSNVNIDSTMGIGDTSKGTGSDSIHLSLAGSLNLPIQYEMGWRTQTFGYAFKPYKGVVVAINLHKHLFEATANGTLSTNLLGNVAMDMPSAHIPVQNLPINYSEEKVYGQVSGHFKGSAWSPAFGVKWWRFTYTSRFGVTSQVNGNFTMKWHTPFFVNPSPKKFGVRQDELMLSGDSNKSPTEMLGDFQQLQTKLSNSETDSFVMVTNKAAEFNIPGGQSLTFDIIPEHLVLSYTYITGGAISGYHQDEAGDVDFNLGFNVNHFVVINAAVGRAKVTVGAFLLDFYAGDKKHWLSNSLGFEKYGGVPMPILNFGTTIGSAARVLIELDVLPIPALKSGIVYYF